MPGLVGARVRRAEDPRLLRGEGRFVGDLHPTGLLHLAFVRSPHAHAAIRRLDLGAARAMPGVVAAFGPDDLTVLGRPLPPVIQTPGVQVRMPAPLATGEARYMGEAVALVIADDPAVAQDAAAAVTVEYAPLPSVVDAERGVRDGSLLVHADLSTNVAGDLKRRIGDPDSVFASADVVLRERFSAARAAGVAIEPRGVLAQPGSPDRTDGIDVTLWTSTQAPHLVRRGVAGALGLEPEELRVITPDVGGGFGPKGRLYAEEAALAAVARHLGRPVAWIPSRREDLQATYAGRGLVVEAELAATSSGQVLGLRARLVQDCGAYLPVGMVVPLSSAQHLLGPYPWQALDFEILGVYTHKVPLTPLRGGGRELGVFVTERLLDHLAQRLGIDPIELRLRNVLGADAFPHDTGYPSSESQGTIVYDSGDYPAYLRRARELIGYDEVKRSQPAERQRGCYRGVAVTTFLEATGRDEETARIEALPSGEVRITVGSPSTGQSHATTFAQVCAERLGVPFEQVRYVSGDTQQVGEGVGTFASRMAVVAGNAVALAALELRGQALRAAAARLETAVDDLELVDGSVSIRGAPERRVSLGELAQASANGVLRAEETYSLAGRNAFSGGAHAALVEVDPETGLVQVRRYAVVDDCGTLLNPTVVEGQAHGGVAHGLGNALLERLVYAEDGRLLSTDLPDYAVPSTGEPVSFGSSAEHQPRYRTSVPDILIEHLDQRSSHNPEGIKGAGEGGVIGSLPALVAAVEDALAPFGVRLQELPVRPEHLVRAHEAIVRSVPVAG